MKTVKIMPSKILRYTVLHGKYLNRYVLDMVILTALIAVVTTCIYQCFTIEDPDSI